jgi:hypothetical protein
VYTYLIKIYITVQGLVGYFLNVIH